MLTIRPITHADNAAIEQIIRECLIEFGGNREGLAWADASMHDLHSYYSSADNRAYWIVEEEGTVLGGCGIAAFDGPEQICELQKMYLASGIRGKGIAGELLRTALGFASQHYRKCYLETLQSMEAANRFYLKHGFELLDAPLAGSEHFACDAWYITDLTVLSE
ncbi:GNAT family N-acetyltransferase [Paenibacillus sp. MMS20-IR301]|uniref:GNAT family N-acetyltransferase n=1 Tax=Paenibacillus sp. MMS20-IR301 TaxID=2895946 RepID=UPI0028EABC0E|nr:GNAT family N-acetyltransferase [Paenibacillus sp. MMS20-IR301]WNS45357.1 GNAT family N-acetyltransferase [Paenibacillus sp. MMS20-IR301]